MSVSHNKWSHLFLLLIVAVFVSGCNSEPPPADDSGDTQAPEITLTFPTGGEVISGISLLRWQTVDTNPSTVDIYVSNDSGATFTDLALTVTDEGEYLWDSRQFPNGTNYRVRLQARDAAGNLSEFSESNSDIVIRNEVAPPTGKYNPIHDALDAQYVPHNFYGATVADGKIYGLASTVRDEYNSAFIYDLTSSQLNTLSQHKIDSREVLAVPAHESQLFIEENSLYVASAGGKQLLSGSHEVKFFWLSPNSNTVVFNANYKVTVVFNEITQRNEYLRESELFSVAITGGEIVKISSEEVSVEPLFGLYQNRGEAHNINPKFTSDGTYIVFAQRIMNTGEVQLVSVNLSNGNSAVIYEELLTADEGDDIGDQTFLFELSPDSQSVIFGRNRDAQVSLWIASIVGANPIQLSTENVSVQSYGFSAGFYEQGSRVVFIQETIGSSKGLFSVNLDGTQLLELSNEKVDTNITPFSIPNSDQTAFVAETGIYSTSVTEIGTQLINDDLQYIEQIEVTEDGSQLVVAGNEESSDLAIYRIGISPASFDRISVDMVEDGEIEQSSRQRTYFTFDAANERLVYGAEAFSTRDQLAYSVNVDGTDQTLISPQRTFDRQSSDLSIVGFDGDSVYFTKDTNRWTLEELYVYSYATEITTRINNTWDSINTEDIAGGTLRYSQDKTVFSFVTDSTRFLDLAVVSVNTTTGQSCRIVPEGNDIRMFNGIANFSMDDAGQYVVYTVWESSSEVDVYALETATCNVAHLNSEITDTPNRVMVAPNGEYALIQGSIGSENTGSLSLVQLSGDFPVIDLLPNERVGGVPSGNDGSFDIAPDSSWIAFVANLSGQNHLYTISPTGDDMVQISASVEDGMGALHSTGSYMDAQITPDSSLVLFRARNVDTNRLELYKSNQDKSVFEKISGDLTDADVTDNNSHYSKTSILVSPNSQYVAYVLKGSYQEPNPLYIVDLTQSEFEPIALTGSQFVTTYGNNNYQFTPDSQALIYVASDDLGGMTRLYAVDVDGSDARMLGESTVADGHLRGFRPTNNGQKVFYLADFVDTDTNGLYVVNVDGTDNHFVSAPELINDRGREVFLQVGDSTLIYQTKDSSEKTLTAYDAETEESEVLVDYDLIFGPRIDGGRIPNYVATDTSLYLVGDFREAGTFELFNFQMPTAD